MVVLTHDRYSQATPLNVAQTYTPTVVNGTWSSTSNIQVTDNTYATDVWDAALGADGDILDLTNLGFDIPSDATIDGITVTIERKGSTTLILSDLTVQLLIAGTPSGSNKASPTTYTTSDATATYGSTSDAWGLTPTPADINSTGFGLRFQAQTVSVIGSVTVSIDQITIAVRYTNPSSSQITRLDSDLQFVWRYDLGVNGSGNAWVPGQPLVDDDGNIYVRSVAGIGGSPRKSEVQVTKLDADANLLWTYSIGTIEDPAGIFNVDAPISLVAFSPLCFDQSGNVVVTHPPTATTLYVITVLDVSGSPVLQVNYTAGGIPGGINFLIPGPTGVGVDSSGNIFIGINETPAQIIKLDSSGNYVTRTLTINGGLVVDPVNDVLYHPTVGSAQATTAVAYRKRLCSDLSEVWNRTYVNINSSVSGSNQSCLARQIGLDELTSGIIGGVSCANGTTLLTNWARIDDSGTIDYAIERRDPIKLLGTGFMCAVDSDLGVAYLVNADSGTEKRIFKVNAITGVLERSGFAPGITNGVNTPIIWGAFAKTFIP